MRPSQDSSTTLEFAKRISMTQVTNKQVKRKMKMGEGDKIVIPEMKFLSSNIVLYKQEKLYFLISNG